MEANWKRLRRSSTSYENAKIDCLATKAGSKKEEEEIQRWEHCHINLTAVVMELNMKTDSWRIYGSVHGLIWKNVTEWWLLFTLASIFHSFRNSSVIVSISISVFTEVLVVSFGLEVVDIFNHCWFEKNVIEMMLWFHEKQRYFDFLK